MKKKYILNIFVLIITILILLLVFEVSLRIFYPQFVLKKSHIEASIPIYKNGENIPWELKPLSEAKHSNIFEEYNTSIKINNFGLRDNKFNARLDKNTKRILLLGDSFTFGFGVEQEETYGSILENLLNKNYTILNAGVGGYSLDMEYIYLKEKGLKFNPDIVIVGFFIGNDVRDIDSHKWVELDEKKLPKKIASNKVYIDNQSRLRAIGDEDVIKDNSFPILYNLNVFLSYKFHIYIFFKDRLKILFYKLTGQEESFEKSIYRSYYDNETELLWKKTEDILLEMNQLVGENGKPFVIALIPSRDQLNKEKDDTYSFTNPNRRLVNFGKGHNLIIIDLLPYFKEINNSKKFYYEKDSHWNSDGHKFAGKKIYERLKELNLV